MSKKEGMNFPYYSLRSYDKISIEGQYRVVDTYWGRYILDYKDRYRGETLAERRLQLRTALDLPYKVYNLEDRCTNVAQMLMANNNVFIDALGNIKKLRKPTRYKVLCCPIVSIVELGYKRYGISFYLGGVIEYFIHNEPCNFLQVLVLKTGWLYYAALKDAVPDTIRGL